MIDHEFTSWDEIKNEVDWHHSHLSSNPLNSFRNTIWSAWSDRTLICLLIFTLVCLIIHLSSHLPHLPALTALPVPPTYPACPTCLAYPACTFGSPWSINASSSHCTCLICSIIDSLIFSPYISCPACLGPSCPPRLSLGWVISAHRIARSIFESIISLCRSAVFIWTYSNREGSRLIKSRISYSLNVISIVSVFMLSIWMHVLCISRTISRISNLWFLSIKTMEWYAWITKGYPHTLWLSAFECWGSSALGVQQR